MENQQERLLHIDVDEDDPFKELRLSVVAEDAGLGVGRVDAEPGRYVLIREESDADGE